MSSVYYDPASMGSILASGQHRDIIGGMWDEIGLMQLDMLKQQGLLPHHVLLDLGCGCLRLGCKAVAYLEPGKYWGTDLVQELMDTGYEKELVPLGLATRLPRSQLVQDTEFTFDSIPDNIDFVIAQSVFTHLPLNHLRLCLARLALHLKGPATFLFTIFEPEPGTAIHESSKQSRGGVVTHPHKDPFHMRLEDLHYAAHDLPWSIEFIGDWNHPRNQKLVRAVLEK